MAKHHSDIKKEFPSLEDLMFKNKSAQKFSKKKKNFKKLNEFNKLKNDQNEHNKLEF